MSESTSISAEIRENNISAKILRRADIDAKTSKNFAAEIDKTFDLDGQYMISILDQSSITKLHLFLTK